MTALRFCLIITRTLTFCLIFVYAIASSIELKQSENQPLTEEK